jgi:hypothetical protein
MNPSHAETIRLATILLLGQSAALVAGQYAPSPARALLLTLPWTIAFQRAAACPDAGAVRSGLLYALVIQSFLIGLVVRGAADLGITQFVAMGLIWYAEGVAGRKGRAAVTRIDWLFPLRGRWLAYFFAGLISLAAVVLVGGAGLKFAALQN